MREITLEAKDLCEILGVKSLTLSTLTIFQSESPIVYRDLSSADSERVMEEITEKINDPSTRKAGPEFRENWERNWNENLSKFENGIEDSALIPAFISSSEILRFRGNYIQPLSPNFEMKIVRILRHFLYEKFLTDVDELHEFGAGTGFNLIQFCEVFPKKIAYAYDWSPSAIELIKQVGNAKGLQIEARLFDMFDPDSKLSIGSNAGLLTVGAMEQLGTNWKAFLDFMISKRFKVFINIETIYEYSQSQTRYTQVAKEYIRRRNWLQGYHQELRRLENEGTIEILTQQVVIGSRFHDSWSYTVWKLKNV